MTTATQTDVEQQTGPGSAAPATQQPTSAVPKEKKPRKPSRKVQALIDAAYERGVTSGLNTAREQPSGFWIWMVVSLVAGFVLRGYAWKH